MNKMITFDSYRKFHAYSSNTSPANINYILRLWKENKNQYLTKLFDNELILTRDIRYEKTKSELQRQASALLSRYKEFTHNYQIKVAATFGLDLFHIDLNSEKDLCFYDIIHFINIYSISDNRITGLHKSKFTVILNNHTIEIQEGMKTMKALSKICAAIGLEKEFEEFRLAQSLLTNQRTITGRLHLSIHPMDFATASDNNNGWSSCMSWSNCGCYRLGTTEMMNSSMVISAYISSDVAKLNCPDDNCWNSKKWRAWVVIHPQFIFVNRHYPYHSDEIATEVLNWVKELVAEKLQWYYGPVIKDMVSYWNHEGMEENIIINTNYMYNDIGGDDILGCMSTIYTPNEKNYEYEINISGPAECMNCGEIIDWKDKYEADTLLCIDCRDDLTSCERCGNFIDGNTEYVITPEGYTYCTDCYAENYTQCHCCGKIININNSSTFNILLPSHKVYKYSFYRACATATICNDCFNNYLEKNWFIDANDYNKYLFDNAELNLAWQKNMTSYDEEYFINPDPSIKYTKEELMILFGKNIDVDDYCCSQVCYNDIYWGKIDISVWQNHLII